MTCEHMFYSILSNYNRHLPYYTHPEVYTGLSIGESIAEHRSVNAVKCRYSALIKELRSAMCHDIRRVGAPAMR